MFAKPYNLKLGELDSNQFYSTLAVFTDEVLNYASNNQHNTIGNYTQFLKTNNIKEYSNNEYLVELLTIGILWTNYQKHLSIDAVFYAPIFNMLYKRRQRNPKLKTRIDKLRGKLNHAVLLQTRNKDIEIKDRFDYLIAWLSDSKEFDQELKRMHNWRLFVERMSLSEQANFWNITIDLANWFNKTANHFLGKYTSNWENFMMDTATIYTGREDEIFCTRKPNEYHLNMIAAEIINRTLSTKANKAKNKIVLLPTCMIESKNCKATIIDNKLTCQNCSSTCNVNKIKQKIINSTTSTVLIPHSGGFSKYIKQWKDSKDTSLIGVACVLNLIKGGYEIQSLNIPAQCVFLDSCSCEKHWLNGEATQLNQEQLLKVLKQENAKQPVNSTC